jgi:5-hydroxyisourate hydrolase-like protein (transthyretin family)
MRYIKDIPHQHFKISIYQWNNKYIIKVESGMYEQTYKIDEYEVASVAEIEKCMDKSFLESVAMKFREMDENFRGTLVRNEVVF